MLSLLFLRAEAVDEEGPAWGSWISRTVLRADDLSLSLLRGLMPGLDQSEISKDGRSIGVMGVLKCSAL